MKEKTKKSHTLHAFSRGFTLVELIIVLAIFMIITSIAVSSNSQFNSSVLLTNLAYEVALSVRQAQVYGITVKAGGSIGAPVFDSGYGIHFDFSPSSPITYVLFEDKDPAGATPASRTYDSGEDIESFKLRQGNYISKICLDNESDGSCSKGGSGDTVDISFIRPDPEATIVRGGTKYNCAEIYLSSPQGTTRQIIVETNGQISVDATGTASCN